jgi:hypothetical protein
MRRRRHFVVAAVFSILLFQAAAFAAPVPYERVPLDRWDVDGTTVRGVARHHVAVVDPVSGSLISGFDPEPDDAVWALESIGGVVCLGGPVSTVSGVSVRHLAAVDAITGAFRSSFDPDPDQAVNALRAAHDDARLYVGGQWTRIAGADVRLDRRPGSDDWRAGRSHLREPDGCGHGSRGE